MSVFRKVVLTLAVLASLSGCGFHLRGSGGEYRMPFKSIFLNFQDTSSLGVELRRNLRGGNLVEVTNDATKAEAQFDVVAESRGKQILSLKGQGRVGEYLLTYTVVFKVTDANGRLLLAPTEISLKRSLPFDERQVLAKESEEVLLYRDMQSDLVQQILRRMTAIKPE
ncbi:MAG TPA: LPS assembly lipoprotein LptE [Telluria sp.]